MQLRLREQRLERAHLYASTGSVGDDDDAHDVPDLRHLDANRDRRRAFRGETDRRATRAKLGDERRGHDACRRWKRGEETRDLHVEQIRGAGDARAVAVRCRTHADHDFLTALAAKRAEVGPFFVEERRVERRPAREKRLGQRSSTSAGLDRRRRFLKRALRCAHESQSLLTTPARRHSVAAIPT